MNFGKVIDLEHVVFDMPPDHPQTVLTLHDHLQGQGRVPEIYVGATGWSNPEWNGSWYPAKTKPNDFLQHYSRQFGTIEFNTTHYRVPDDDLILRWYTGASPGFKFCPKVPQQISHRARLKAEAPTTAFCSAIAGLKEKLGPTFLQLPDTHGPSAAAAVLDFARDWPRELPLHWEFRHPDWFTGHAGAEQVFEKLAELGQGLVITDVAGRRDVLHMRLTNPVLVLRFVGNGLRPTDFSRLKAWAARIEDWTSQGLHAAYIFIHQPEMTDVPAYCIQWAEALQQITGAKVLQPSPWTPPRPAQQSLF